MANVSFRFVSNLTEEDKKWLIVPNGIYLMQLKIWDSDGDGGDFTFFLEVKFRNRSLSTSGLIFS